MKKIVSVFLAVLMIFTVTVPASTAFAVEHNYEKYPIIYIRGGGESIYLPDGTEIVADIGAISGIGERTKEEIINKIVDIMIPFFAGGMVNDSWEACADEIYTALAPYWDKSRLDGNGNPQYGTAVSSSALSDSEYNATLDLGTDGYYGIYEYGFVYDWRLSPYDHVDRLDKYIHSIMDVTGAEQVGIATVSMGGTLLNAYMEKYGDQGHIKKIFYGIVLANGCSVVSDAFSGKLAVHDKALQNYLKHIECCGENGYSMGVTFNDFLSELIGSTVDVLTQTGVMNAFGESFNSIYNKMYHELIPAICLATGLATYPNYWASVYDEDFDSALNLVFGSEDSERYTEYAGLIEKIKYYREHVNRDLTGLYKGIEKSGIEVGVFANYGYLSIPFTEHHDELSDALVALPEASFGATTATVYTTLSESYIQNRIDLGFEDYISPDKKIDASTCLFPETTWFVKNAHHDDWAPIYDTIVTQFFWYSNTTTSSNVNNISRFSMYTRNYSNPLVPMTEDNMAGFDWLETAEQNPTISTKLASLMKFFKVILEFFTKLLKGEISFSELF